MSYTNSKDSFRVRRYAEFQFGSGTTTTVLDSSNLS